MNVFYFLILDFQVGQFEATICPTYFLVDVNGSGSLHLQQYEEIETRFATSL